MSAGPIRASTERVTTRLTPTGAFVTLATAASTVTLVRTVQLPSKLSAYRLFVGHLHSSLYPLHMTSVSAKLYIIRIYFDRH